MLEELIPGPLDEKNYVKCLEEIETSFNEGKQHILYYDYTLQYGDNGLYSNILIPYNDNVEGKEKYMIIINDPEDAENIAEDHVKKMPNLKRYIKEGLLSTTDNKSWMKQRSHFGPAFNLEDELKPNIKLSNTLSESGVKKLHNLEKEGEVNMSEFFLYETLKQLLVVMFGTTENYNSKMNSQIRLGFKDFDENLLKENIKSMELIINKLEGPLGKKLNNNFPEEEFLGNIIIFLFAGHDTTGHTLTWLIYELSKNNIIQDRFVKEVDEFWKKQGNKDIKYEDFKRLPFMTRCIMETLRLWPAIPNGTFRELVEDDYIKGRNNKKVKIPKGTYVQIPNWIRHRHPDLWDDDVDIFNPYRKFKDDELWNGTVINSYNPSSNRFSPFTYGPRDCIGKNFSQIEMRLILLHLFKNFRILPSLNKNKYQNKNNMGFNTFTMGPRNPKNKDLKDNTLGLYVKIVPRNHKSKL